MSQNQARIALITGGAGVLGRAMISALLRDGYRVAIADLSLQKAQKAATECSGIATKKWSMS